MMQAASTAALAHCMHDAVSVLNNALLPAGNAAEKTRKLYQGKVDAINALEPAMQALSDEALRGKTKELQNRYQDGESLDALLPEAFAVR